MDFEMVAGLLDTKGHFYFNIDANVGKGQPNLPDDVDLVRFAYFTMREGRSPNPVTLGLRAKLGGTLTNVNPSGAFGPDLDAVIRAHQAIRGGTQDGRISVIPGSGTYGMQYDGTHTWTLVILVNTIRHYMLDLYPRLDKDDKCGPHLRDTCRKLFAY